MGSETELVNWNQKSNLGKAESFMSPAEKRQAMSFWIPGKASVTPVLQRAMFVLGVLPVEIFKLSWHSNIQSLHLYYTLRKEAAEIGN